MSDSYPPDSGPFCQAPDCWDEAAFCGRHAGESNEYVPAEVLEALHAWMLHGKRPGGFLTSCLEDDFTGAVLRADPVNRHHLRAIALHITWELPASCWGSKQKVDDWEASFHVGGGPREETGDDERSNSPYDPKDYTE